jgi:hypothetical protein
MNRSIFHIADQNSSKYRPAMTNTFSVIIPDLEGLVDKTSQNEGAVIGQDAETVLKVSNENFKEPSLQQETVQLKRGNLTMVFPGQIQAFSSETAFSCFIDADTYGKLYTWKCLAGDHETGEVGDPKDYWRTVTIQHLTGKGELIGTWTLHNCWCSALSGATFDNKSASIKEVSVTLQYFRPEWRKA